MRNVSNESVYKDRSVSKNINDEEGTHLFMAQESKDESHISSSDHVDHSYRQDVFGSDSEGEEENESEVDLEGELVSALEELSRVRNEYKLFKNVAVMEQNQLIRCFQDSEKCILELIQEGTKECQCNDLASELEAKEKEYQQLKGDMQNLRKDFEKCQD